MTRRLNSERHLLHENEVADYFIDHLWSDGLPTIAPTEVRVGRMLDHTALAPDDVVGVVGPRGAPASVEKIAINAVMAGCRPEYLPTVIAAVRAVADPVFNLGSAEIGGGPWTPMLIVNGPVRHAIGLNHGYDVLGPGCRANATIGRALRLVIRNIGGSIPGQTDLAVHGQPAKYSCCIAEHEEASPWPPLHVERGFDPEVSTVTAVLIASTVDVLCLAEDASGLLHTMAGSYRRLGNAEFVRSREACFLLPPDWMLKLVEAGVTKDDIRHYLFEHARMRLGDFCAEDQHVIANSHSAESTSEGPDSMIPVANSPADFMIVVTGSPNVDHATNITCAPHGYSVTVPLDDNRTA